MKYFCLIVVSFAIVSFGIASDNRNSPPVDSGFTKKILQYCYAKIEQQIITNIKTFEEECGLKHPSNENLSYLLKEEILKNENSILGSIIITSVNPSICDANTNTYSLDVEVNYTAPPTGNINISTSNGGSISVTQTGSPQTITLTNLTANGLQDIDITAVFANDATCTNTLNAAYDTPFSCYEQVQTELETPSSLSTCNLDTICLSIANIEGEKNTTYEDISVELNLPNAELLNVLSDSTFSIPAGVAVSSYINNVLTVSIPMPAFGATTKVCVVVRPSCDITTITPLPQLHATVNYPAGYPISTESVTSVPMNVGNVSINHSFYSQSSFKDPTPDFGRLYRIITRIENTSFNDQKEVICKAIVPTAQILSGARSVPLSSTGVFDNNAGPLNPISIEPYDAENNLVTYILSGRLLGTNGVLAPGETVLFEQTLRASQECATYVSRRWAELSCGENEPLCIVPDTLYSNIAQTAGIPSLAGELVSIEDADGCPNKQGVFTITNNGATGTAPFVGNAYDVDLGISFNSGLMILSNIQMNGMAVPVANLTPNGLAATSTSILLKDLMTTDPDGVGVGIEDLDGDGFFDDMAAGAETEISFDYTIPCDLACGALLDYELTSYNTFTDYCRNLTGLTSTPLHKFGFEQVQAIEQLEDVDYGVLTSGDSETRTAKFQFQYKQNNMDFTNAIGELRIRYSESMELDPSTILLNGVPPTNTPILMGDNSTGALPDTDSMYVVPLTLAELTTLFDNTSDNLWYDQTYYGCDIRQNSMTGDNWQLNVQINQNPCSDSSEACSFDVACKKPFVYSSGVTCGTKPCYINDVQIYREASTGYTSVDETAGISPIDSSRSWEGDTVVFRHGIFITGDVIHEPNGFWTAQGRADKDLRTNFALKYSIPEGWNEEETIWTFLESISTVAIYERTPVADELEKGTIGAKIIEVPIILGDFASNGEAESATQQHAFNATVTEYQDDTNSSPEWYCANYNTAIQISGICPAQNRQWTDANLDNIHHRRFKNTADNKMSESYYLNIGKALARSGWTGNTGEDNFYFEVKTKWRMSESFPWDNSNSFSLNGFTRHSGDADIYAPNHGTNPASTYTGNCNDYGATHLTTTKEHYIDNPNSVYKSDCSLKVNHDVFFDAYENDYFLDGEVRVPLKVDSIVIDLPSEYGIIPGTFNWKYNQSCGDLNSTAVDASAATGPVIFTPTGGGDFPRADDCSGNKVAYQLCYTLEKTGTAAPTQYKYPVTVYGRNESGQAVILRDSVGISEVNPELVLTSLSPILTPADGGTCEPAFFDFRIQNTSLYDAPHVYLAAESTADITMVNVDDGDNVYTDPIRTADVNTYGASNVFAQIGTIKAGEIRVVRVYANTTSCSGSFDVYADFGCDYPSPSEPNLASATIDQTSAQFMAQAPGLAASPVSEIDVTNLCDIQTVEIEIRNVRLGNLYNGNILFDLPDGATLVTGTEEYRYLNLSDFTWTDIPPTDVTQPAADMVNFNLVNVEPFNTSCGLPGSDKFTESQIRVRFNIDFSACPTSATEFVSYTASGENFCGTETSALGIVKINYIGETSARNNYQIIENPNPIIVCAASNEQQMVNDSMILKNIGGYGTASGTSTGEEKIEFTLIYDDVNFDISDVSFNAGFNTPTITTNAEGNTVLTTNVPAGLIVDASQDMVLSYNLTPKINNVCLIEGAAICYSIEIKSEPDLSCVPKSLDCNATFESIFGAEFSTREFACCKVGLGNLVFSDITGDGIFDIGQDSGIDGVTVELYPSGSNIGVDTPLATTMTGSGGYYLFDHLDPGDYIVYLPASNFTTGAALENMQPDIVEGGDDNTDDNGDENGQNTLVMGGIVSGVIALQANAEPTNEGGAGTYTGSLDDDDVNLTVDFGFMPMIDYPDYPNGNVPCAEAPCHIIDDNLHLGSSVSADIPPNSGVVSDSDDDNGLSLNANLQFTPGNTVNLPVEVYNNTGSIAFLRLWIDWNGDGNFTDTNEQVADMTHPSTGTTDIVTVSITIPVDVVQNQNLSVRIRLSSDALNSVSPCGIGICAADGEVEDYSIQMSCPSNICTPVLLIRKSGNP